MISRKLFVIAVLLLFMCLCSAVTIYQIQYTTNPGNGSYPSHHAGQYVTTQGVVVTLPSLQAPVNAQVTVPVNVSNLTMTQAYQSYQFQLSYNPALLAYVSYRTAGTLSSAGSVMATPSAGVLNVSFSANGYILGQGTLLNLNFNAVNSGVSPLTASNFRFNNTPVMLINQGLVTIGVSGGEVIDTLSVIQRPLLNIPVITVPGETFSIECVAPPSTTGWAAWLYRGNLSHSLPIIASQYASAPPRWILTAQVPNVNVFELYNLRVTASGGINDRTRNSVQVLPTRKTSYYFAHLTDTHLPTRIFYPDLGYATDSTETVDLREVIRDINIIRPEFVLLTGDLVNQGELEEFENMRVYTKAKRLLGEFEVPVYLVAGNHDIGGWPGTAPPAGSARRFWWKNFGWSWLNNTSTSWQHHTQDYSFDYGPVRYVGLESYDNYDNYLPSIYGAESFTNNQTAWLQTVLAAAGNSQKVLFYHNDFDNELNLSSLGVGMALSGHIHYNSGSLTTTPYNLTTDNVSDGTRAYRIVRVNGTNLQPLATSYAGSSGNQIRISFTPNNYGISNSVTASVVNNQPISFENAVVKFKMPAGNSEYTVTGGVLEQVDRSGDFNVCYVRLNLTASSTVTATISVNTISVDPQNTPFATPQLNAVYPNPFRETVTLSLNTEKAGRIGIKIYNLKGELVRTLFTGKAASGTHYFSWDGRDELNRPSSAGIYIARLFGGTTAQSRKLIKLR